MCVIMVVLRLLVLLKSTIPVWSGDFVFSYRLADNVMVTLIGQSLPACQLECQTRPACRSANYRRAFQLCELNSVDENDVQLAPSPGDVYIRKQGDVQSCQSHQCSDGQVCQNDACEVRECSRPLLEHIEVLGNMYDVDARIIVSCETGYVMVINQHLHLTNVTLTCLSTGIWDGLEFTCQPLSVCMNELVSGDQPIADSALTASSTWENLADHGPKNARLKFVGVGAWVAGYLNLPQYIQAKFSSVKIVTGVVTMPRVTKPDQYLTSYSLSYSHDCLTFTPITDADGSTKTFSGNSASNDLQTNLLPQPITALCMRINALTFNVHISTRFDILGCNL